MKDRDYDNIVVDKEKKKIVWSMSESEYIEANFKQVNDVPFNLLVKLAKSYTDSNQK